MNFATLHDMSSTQLAAYVRMAYRLALVLHKQGCAEEASAQAYWAQQARRVRTIRDRVEGA